MIINQNDDKFSIWWPFWISPLTHYSLCREDKGFVDFEYGHLQKNSAFYILDSPISYSIASGL